MSDKTFSVPHFVAAGDLFDRHLPVIGEDQLAFSDTRQDRDLTFLPKLAVDAVFFHGDAEHSAGGLAIQILAFPERVQRGGFSGEPGDDAGFDCREICHHEAMPFCGDEGGADQLGKRVRNGLVEQLDHVEQPTSHEATSLSQVWEVVAGQVLDLHEATCEPAGASCTVKLQETPPSTISPCDVLHRLILLHRGLCEFAAQLQCFFHWPSCGVECAGDFGLCE